MPDVSYAKKVMGDRQPEDTGESRPWRNGFSGDNAGGANPFSLSLRFKDGRHLEGFSMSLYVRHHWMDEGGQVERLLLVFSVGGVYVEGHHLKKQVDALLEEGKLKRIQEHDSAEIAAITAHNLDKRKEEDKEPVVLRVVVSPGIDAVLENDENLAAIADAIKGEQEREDRGNSGFTGGVGR